LNHRVHCKKMKSIPQSEIFSVPLRMDTFLHQKVERDERKDGEMIYWGAWLVGTCTTILVQVAGVVDNKQPSIGGG